MLFATSCNILKNAGFNIPDTAIANCIKPEDFSPAFSEKMTVSGTTSKLEFWQSLRPTETATVSMDEIVIRDEEYPFAVGDMCIVKTPTWVMIECKETPETEPFQLSGDVIIIQKYRRDGKPRVKITAEDALGDARTFWATSSASMSVSLHAIDTDD